MVDRDYMRDDYGGGGGFGGGGTQFRLPSLTRAVKVLIIVNVAIFLAEMLLAFAYKGLHLHLGLSTLNPLLWPVQIFTYQFLHGDFHHIFFNMLGLYFFGSTVERDLGTRRFLRLYFFSGIAGGLGFLLVELLQRSGVPVIGASGAVSGVVLYFCCTHPRSLVIFIIFPIQAWVLGVFWGGGALLYLIQDLQRGGGSGVAHSAHLGGALLGFLFWRYEGLVRRLLEGVARRPAADRAKKEAADQARMDELLAKVNREGLTALTEGERKFLQEMSQRLKKR